MIDLSSTSNEPNKIRFYYLLLLLLVLAIIWSSYFSFIRNLEISRIEEIHQKSALETVLFEDHLSRSLDTVESVLDSIELLTNEKIVNDNRFKSDFLRDLIYQHPIVRSLSLIDPAGQVIASSEPKNIGSAVNLNDVEPTKDLNPNQKIEYGRVSPQRDLYQKKSPGNESPSIWLISKKIISDGKTYRWVLAINLNLFLNLWARSDIYPSTKLGVIDYKGNWVFGSDPTFIPSSQLGGQVIQAVDKKEIGEFITEEKPQYFIAYRMSRLHPIIMLSLNDEKLAIAQLKPERLSRLLVAIGASTAATLIIFLLFRAYLRYERTNTELLNQSTAISKHVMISEFNPKGFITNVNDKMEEVSGYSKLELIGRSFQNFNSEFSKTSEHEVMLKDINSGKIWQGIFKNKKRSGDDYWVSATIIPFKDVWGRLVRYVALYSDVTQMFSIQEKYETERSARAQLASINRSLAIDVNTDPLTKLANRRAFDLFISNFIKDPKNHKHPLSLLVLDLDYFKEINDTYGHHAGDQVLSELSNRWKLEIRSSDMIARIGGEEFCIVLPDTNIAQAELIAQKIIRATNETSLNVSVNNKSIALHATVSIGLSGSNRINPDTFKTLLQNADVALYQSKDNGRNRYSIYKDKPV